MSQEQHPALQAIIEKAYAEGMITENVTFSSDMRIPYHIGEQMEEINREELHAAATLVLQSTTGWVDDDHGHDTPARFLKMLRELTTPQPFDFKTFPSDSDEMIVVRNIPFVSLCNHHVIPFVGTAHIGYVPDGKIAGLSKFARAVQYHAKALQVQERLTTQIADFIEHKLRPRGIVVLMEAEHMCMTIRGVQAPGTKTRTTAVRGVFADHSRSAKAEFLAAVNGH